MSKRRNYNTLNLNISYRTIFDLGQKFIGILIRVGCLGSDLRLYRACKKQLYSGKSWKEVADMFDFSSKQALSTFLKNTERTQHES